MNVTPKKNLGQHFLKDTEIADRIVGCLTGFGGWKQVLEIGPGTGVLTTRLKAANTDLYVSEIDRESVEYLTRQGIVQSDRILGDVLSLDLSGTFAGPVALIGNLPYNISSQIFFRLLECRDQVPEMVCMIQKEVAERLAAPPGHRDNGKLSILLQAFYDIRYEFTVSPHVFLPPPKVQSAVITLRRNNRQALPCDEKLFTRIVKLAFQQRRKMLRNALAEVLTPEMIAEPFFQKRAEQLGVEDYIALTQRLAALGR